MQTRIMHITFALLLGLTLAIPMLAQAEDLVVSDGKEVSFQYILRLDDNKIYDGNIEGDPLVFTYGVGQIIPGLEKGMAGMKKGERKKITVKPADAYGEIRKSAYIELKKSQIESPEKLKVGSYLPMDASGQTLNVKVVEIKEDSVVVDGNHPLAGKTLHFEILVVDVKEPSAK